MNDNAYVWIVLALIALIALHVKGYIRLPIPPFAGGRDAELGTKELSVLLARAALREAHENVATHAAEIARKKIVEAMEIPFAVPDGTEKDATPPA